jgi:hypothetical protein
MQSSKKRKLRCKVSMRDMNKAIKQMEIRDQKVFSEDDEIPQ